MTAKEITLISKPDKKKKGKEQQQQKTLYADNMQEASMLSYDKKTTLKQEMKITERAL